MSTTFGYGQLDPEDTATDFNNIAFIFKQLAANIRTAGLVSVNSCTNNGGISKVGMVSVTLLVNMLDGQGRSQAHGQIFNLPYFRIQGGVNGAVICDPVAGDIGVAVICDRDISAVKKTGAAANPGSYRRFDLSDGLYIGGFLNAVPACYVQFDGQGNINIVDANGNKIQMSSAGIAITGNVAITGSLTATQGIIAGQGGIDQVGLQTHNHPGNGSPPTPGT